MATNSMILCSASLFTAASAALFVFTAACPKVNVACCMICVLCVFKYVIGRLNSILLFVWWNLVDTADLKSVSFLSKGSSPLMGSLQSVVWLLYLLCIIFSCLVCFRVLSFINEVSWFFGYMLMCCLFVVVEFVNQVIIAFIILFSALRNF